MWKRANIVKAAQGNINSVIKKTTTKYGKEIESDNKKMKSIMANMHYR